MTGATKGIGLATTRLLLAEGAHVLLVARNEPQTPLSGSHEFLEADINDPATPERVLAAAPQIDVLVNNAGTTNARPWAQLTDADWQAQWELNVMAPMRLMRALVPPMADRGWGRVVNVSSSSGKRPSRRNMAYSVTKAAELSLSRAFAGRGVRINAVTPGVVATGLWTGPGGLADQAADAQGITPEAALEQVAGAIPIGRVGEPEQIASMVVLLCSERADNVAGAAWSVDGGSVDVII
ncbi:MAG TPA: SDR family oxidoreductase [Solirubrobacteraceae bacterium]|nr:SDR family oxidoreductase [Solirubrobacteraceae bacterium]